MNTPAFPSIHPVATANRRPGCLSARQLLDVELGLFLLSQLQPSASPSALPVLLQKDASLPDQTGWTPRQQKLLNRGRLLLTQFQYAAAWHELLDRYVTQSNPLRQAYDISTDRSRFAEKNVGFFRNRTSVFKSILA